MIAEEEAKGEEIEQYHHQKQSLEKHRLDDKVLQFLDTMDNYINQLDSLSATLRQGWLELASARHSMGVSRLNSSLVDLNNHTAATSLHVSEGHDSTSRQPHFLLQKLISTNIEEGFDDEKATSEFSGKLEQASTKKKEPVKTGGKGQEERSKLLSMFGTLVSPKLRAAQISFETALETLVEIANERTSILSSFDQVKKDIEGDTD